MLPGHARGAMRFCTWAASASGRRAASHRSRSRMRCTRTQRSARLLAAGGVRGARRCGPRCPTGTCAGAAGSPGHAAQAPSRTRAGGRALAAAPGTAVRQAHATPGRVRRAPPASRWCASAVRRPQLRCAARSSGSICRRSSQKSRSHRWSAPWAVSSPAPSRAASAWPAACTLAPGLAMRGRAASARCR